MDKKLLDMKLICMFFRLRLEYVVPYPCHPLDMPMNLVISFGTRGSLAFTVLSCLCARIVRQARSSSSHSLFVVSVDTC